MDGCTAPSAAREPILASGCYLGRSEPYQDMRTLITLGLAAAALHLGAQEFSHTFGSTKAVPESFSLDKSGCRDNMALAAGFRYTRPLGERFGLGFGVAHEWRRASAEQETPDGTVPLNEVEGRGVLLQVMGQYKLLTCASKCGGTFGVMMGADVSLPYRTNALRFDASGSELSSGRVDAAFQAGLALRAGVRYSIPLCHSMGFFMEPQVVYKAVLDRTDEAFVEGRGGSRVGDRLGMGMQGGVYLSLAGGCPMTKAE